MSKEDIIRMAQEAGLYHFYDSEGHCTGITNARLVDEDKERWDDRLVEMLAPFAALVAAAERVLQIRQVLVSAFGTASTEAIQKMGLSADVAIGKIIAGLEQLPKATQSALTTFENLQDALTAAFLPIGRGILDIFGSAESGTTRLIDLVANIGKQIGEVFSAIGKSGVIQDVFSKFLSGTGVANFQQMMVGAIANILAYLGQIPSFWIKQ